MACLGEANMIVDTSQSAALLGVLGWRLVRLIETHSDQLARGLAKEVVP